MLKLPPHSSLHGHSACASGRSTPRSGRSTPGRPFIEDRNKAVFLSGLQEVHGPAYGEYRNQCYKDLQLPMPNGDKVYIRRFDFAPRSTHAFAHFREESMAKYLLEKGKIVLDGHMVQVYEYTPADERVDERTGEMPIINIETGNDSLSVNRSSNGSSPVQCKRIFDAALEGIQKNDSNYGSSCGSPRLRGQASQRVTFNPLRTPEPATSVLDECKMNSLREKIGELSNNQSERIDMKQISLRQIANQIQLPANAFDQNTASHIIREGAAIISSGCITVDEFNQQFAAVFNHRLRQIVMTVR